MNSRFNELKRPAPLLYFDGPSSLPCGRKCIEVLIEVGYWDSNSGVYLPGYYALNNEISLLKLNSLGLIRS